MSQIEQDDNNDGRGRCQSLEPEQRGQQPDVSPIRCNMSCLHAKSVTLPLANATKKKLGKRYVARTVAKDLRTGYRSRTFKSNKVNFHNFKGVAWIKNTCIIVHAGHFSVLRSFAKRVNLSLLYVCPSGQMRTKTLELDNYSSTTHKIDGLLIKACITPASCLQQHECLKKAATDVICPGRKQMIYVKCAHYDKYFVAGIDARDNLCCPSCKFTTHGQSSTNKTRRFNTHLGLDGRWNALAWQLYTAGTSKCDCCTCVREVKLHKLVHSALGTPVPDVENTLMDLATNAATFDDFRVRVQAQACSLHNFSLSNEFLATAYKLAH